MRWPYVEANGEYSFASIYYGTDSPVADASRVDVDSRRYVMSEVLRDIALLGGDTTDIIDTTLLFVSNIVCREMTLSVTVEPIMQLAELNGTELTDEFATRLVDRAATTMVGAALIGALRAIGWAAWVVWLVPLRATISQRARDEARRVGLISGHAMLVADDAHVHLATAQRIQPPAEEPRRTEVLQSRQLMAGQGCRFLAVAFTMALLEPWNPFVRHRLVAELEEHRPAVTFLASEEQFLWQLVERAATQLDDRWAVATASWRTEIEERKAHDIAAYFWTRRESPRAQSRTELAPEFAALCKNEPRWTRLV